MTRARHIGFIMDGNRRFARRLMLEPWKGHELGKEKFRDVLEWLKDLDIREATFYAFSAQNFDRPKKEFDFLMRIFCETCEEILEDPKFSEQDIRINIAGNIARFPEEVRNQIARLTEATAKNTSYTVNLAFGYGGREEIVAAISEIAQEVADGQIGPTSIDASMVQSHLQIQSEPDLVIRTGGDCRTSNFLPWQSIYAEWFFLDKSWPEFTKEDLVACLDRFDQRERRFGK